MRKILIFLIFCSLSLEAYSQPTTFQWSRIFGHSQNYDELNALKLDSAGNIYVAGYINFGDKRLFVRKYSPTGSLIWEYVHGIKSDARDMILDGQGNVYVTGMDTHFGPENMVVVKLNNNGVPLWIYRRNGGGGFGSKLLLTRQYESRLFVGGATLGSYGRIDMLVTRLSPNTGDTIWNYKFG
ncbi:MAG: SBBP repeat-containing protein, partial [Ignavibacteria bacterium]|nr:SBBP repeat-containing protein [Ignavibacteria bacterium]